MDGFRPGAALARRTDERDDHDHGAHHDDASDLHRLRQPILVAARKAQEQARKASAAEVAKLAKRRLTRPAHTLASFRHKLASNNPKKLIPAPTRDEMSGASLMIRGEMTDLRATFQRGAHPSHRGPQAPQAGGACAPAVMEEALMKQI